MVQPARFPTLSAGGFTASIDFVAYEETQWSALIHALSLFGHKTAVDAIRVRLRGGECGTLSCLPDTAARLVLPETFVTRTRRTGDLTHATLLRDPRALTATSFLVVVRDFGILERVTYHDDRTPWREDADEDGAGSIRKGEKGKVYDRPGLSPAIVPLLLNRFVFLRLSDIAHALPPYEEVVHPLPRYRRTSRTRIGIWNARRRNGDGPTGGAAWRSFSRPCSPIPINRGLERPSRRSYVTREGTDTAPWWPRRRCSIPRCATRKKPHSSISSNGNAPADEKFSCS